MMLELLELMILFVLQLHYVLLLKLQEYLNLVSVPTLKLSSIPTDDPAITSPSICDKSCIEAFASGIIPLRDGLSPLIIDIHGLNVTTTSPSF